MYIRAAFGAFGQAEQTVPTIPDSAVQNLANRQVVFVATNEPNVFEMRGGAIGRRKQWKILSSGRLECRR